MAVMVSSASRSGGVKHTRAARPESTVAATVALTAAPSEKLAESLVQRHTLGSKSAAGWQPVGTSPAPRNSRRVPPPTGPTSGSRVASEALVKQKRWPATEKSCALRLTSTAAGPARSPAGVTHCSALEPDEMTAGVVPVVPRPSTKRQTGSEAAAASNSPM